MNSAGSSRSSFGSIFLRMRCRQGLVSQRMGMRPPSLAASRARSSSSDLASATSRNPFESKARPQQSDEVASGKITS